MQNELARQIAEERELAEEQGSMHRSITFSKSLSNSNSNNPVCFICLQNIKPNSKNIFTCTAEYNNIQCGSKIHKKCVKQNCGSASKTYKRKQYINCPICNWAYFCKNDFEKTSDKINKRNKIIKK